jgi:hypothetical protein
MFLPCLGVEFMVVYYTSSILLYLDFFLSFFVYIVLAALALCTSVVQIAIRFWWWKLLSVLHQFLMSQRFGSTSAAAHSS